MSLNRDSEYVAISLETATVLLSASSDGQCHVRDSGYVAISFETATSATVLLSASSDGQCHVRDSSYVAIISFETVTVLLSASSDGQCLIPDDHPVAKSLMRTPHIQKPVQTRPAVVHHDLSS